MQLCGVLIVSTFHIVQAISGGVQTTNYEAICGDNYLENRQPPNSVLSNVNSWTCMSQCSRDVTCYGVNIIPTKSSSTDCHIFNVKIFTPCSGIYGQVGAKFYVKQNYLFHLCEPPALYNAEIDACYHVDLVQKSDDVVSVHNICSSYGVNYHPVAINSPQEQAFMATLMAGYPVCKFAWTSGYSDTPGISSPSAWRWVLPYGNEILTMTYWSGSEPNNASGDQKAIMLAFWAGWGWADMPENPGYHSGYDDQFCLICEHN